MRVDPYEDEIQVKRVQDVEPYLEQNRRDLLGGDGYTPSRDLRRVASIPNIVVEQWMKQGINIFDDNAWPMVAALLDAPEYAKLRTAPGKISRMPTRHYIGGAGSRKSQAEKIQDMESGIGKGI